MYERIGDGALRNVEAWTVILPLHDNMKRRFAGRTIEDIIDELRVEFVGLSILPCRGIWQRFDDRNLMVVMDVPADERGRACRFLLRFKEETARKLGQHSIYVRVQSGAAVLLTGMELLGEQGPRPVAGEAAAPPAPASARPVAPSRLGAFIAALHGRPQE